MSEEYAFGFHQWSGHGHDPAPATYGHHRVKAAQPYEAVKEYVALPSIRESLQVGDTIVGVRVHDYAIFVYYVTERIPPPPPEITIKTTGST